MADQGGGAGGLLDQVLKDWMTDVTGTGYSIGRALGVFYAVIGILLPVGAFLWMAATHPTTWADLGGFLEKTSGYILALGATVTGLILGTAPTDPGGRWWARSNAPPTTTDPQPKPPAPE